MRDVEETNYRVLLHLCNIRSINLPQHHALSPSLSLSPSLFEHFVYRNGAGSTVNQFHSWLLVIFIEKPRSPKTEDQTSNLVPLASWHGRYVSLEGKVVRILL